MATINGTAANNALLIGVFDESNLINAGAGNDTLFGGQLADTLNGGAGNDEVNPGNGADLIYGGAGNDLVYAYYGADTVWGGAGNDRLLGAENNVAITMRGDAGNDTMTGGTGNDMLYGGAGNDRIYGGTGRDRLMGDAGSDRLYGGNGADILTGGAGNDTLVGGQGADTFVFKSANDGADEIIGFSGAGVAGGDRVHLRAMDANADVAGNQDFVFGSVAAGGVSLVEAANGNTIARFNLDGDADFEFTIVMVDGPTTASQYVAGDFIL